MRAFTALVSALNASVYPVAYAMSKLVSEEWFSGYRENI